MVTDEMVEKAITEMARQDITFANCDRTWQRRTIRAALEAALSAAEPQPAPSVAVNALKPFATDADIYDGQDIDDGEKSFNDNITVGDLRRARAAYAAVSAQMQDVAGSPAIKAIAAERRRQIEKEGWTPEHDDKYTSGELLEAATCYALHNGGELDDAPGAWPWSRDFWKPTSRQRDLEKAGALIAAELDRVIRAAAPAKQEGGE
ncbi:hypothetical protein DXT97_12700 [Agrobacterium tumefaciens]|uniref:hypothetical protein n=1 Tax=Agrobacterium tumefaciens TaxID=358 RepID=UPI00129600DA|nr:hypothetical protein [Agrobacterium tumefaciens]MQB37652.1 hypothetical protein [Agrobacterium tumefaciens]